LLDCYVLRRNAGRLCRDDGNVYLHPAHTLSRHTGSDRSQQFRSISRAVIKRQCMKGKIAMTHRKNQKGSAIIEFALCFLLMLSVLYGILEFSRIAYSRTVLAGATREASRYAMVHGRDSGSPADNAAIRSRVLRWGHGLNPTDLVVNTTWDPLDKRPGALVRVETSYTIAPFTRLILGGPLTLSSRSEMVISQ
jgi:hypothetical protein